MSASFKMQKVKPAFTVPTSIVGSTETLIQNTEQMKTKQAKYSP
jgi:hypothetical protein